MVVRIEESWGRALENEFKKDYFLNLTKFVKSEYSKHRNDVFPKGNDIFRAFEACPFEAVKVVILGQDPYPTRGHAHGLCFSVEKNVRPFPKSLLNIFKELEEEFPGYNPQNGDLNRWAEQGVLLLNSVLTVREGVPNSHAGKGWEQFTDAVIHVLNEKRENVVYLLWGSKAIDKATNVSRSKNLVLVAPHPSPLSAYRGFFGCKHFSKANEYLLANGVSPIRW